MYVAILMLASLDEGGKYAWKNRRDGVAHCVCHGTGVYRAGTRFTV